MPGLASGCRGAAALMDREPADLAVLEAIAKHWQWIEKSWCDMQKAMLAYLKHASKHKSGRLRVRKRPDFLPYLEPALVDVLQDACEIV